MSINDNFREEVNNIPIERKFLVECRASGGGLNDNLMPVIMLEAVLHPMDGSPCDEAPKVLYFRMQDAEVLARTVAGTAKALRAENN